MDTLNIEKYGFNHTGNIFRNNPPGALVEKALFNKSRIRTNKNYSI